MATFEDYLASLPEVIECPGCGQRMNRAGVEPLHPDENREPFWCIECSGGTPNAKGTCPLVTQGYIIEARMVVYATTPSRAMAKVESALRPIDPFARTTWAVES